MNLLNSAKGKAMAAWVALPWAGRVTAAIVVFSAAYFFWTSTKRMQNPGAAKSRHRPEPRAAAPQLQQRQRPAPAAAAKMVREAADSAKRAAAAENPYQQLLHVQWAMAKLGAAREVAGGDAENGGGDAELSAESGVHVAKLEAFLTKAQEMCAQRLEAVAAAS
jgi:hypothetical protein